MNERHRRVALALMAAAEEALPGAINPYVVHHLSGHVAAAPAWQELASSAIIDHVDSNAVAADAFRTAFGRADLPVEIAGIMSCHHLLADQPPDVRFTIRQLAHARFGGEIRRAGAAFSPRWTALRPEAVNVVVGSHEEWVQTMDTVAFPDGRVLLAVGDLSGSVRLWDPFAMGPAGEPMVSGFFEWMAPVVTVRLADGRVLLATGCDFQNNVELWDPVTGEKAYEITGANAVVDAMVTFALPDGQVVLAANRFGDIELWEAATGVPMGRLPGVERFCTALAVVPQPDGSVLLAEARQGGDELRLWDPVARTVVRRVAAAADLFEAAAAVDLGDGRAWVAAGNGKQIGLWDAATGRLMASVTPGVDRISCMAAFPLPGGRTVLATGGDRLQLWDPVAGEPIGAPLTARPDVARTMTPMTLADGRVLLATGGEDGAVRLWDLSGHTRVDDSQAGRTMAVAALPDLDGRPVVVTGGVDGAIRFWDVASGAVAAEPMAVHSGAVRSVAVTRLADGRLLMATGGGDGVRLWDVSAGRPAPRRLPSGRQPRNVRAVELVELPDGENVVVAVGEDRQSITRTWVATPRSTRWRRLDINITAMTWVSTRQGHPILVDTDPWGFVHTWDLPQGHHLGELHPECRGVSAGTALPGSPGLLATGGTNGTVRLWDVDERAPVGEPMSGHTGKVSVITTVVLAGGGTALATGSGDGTIRLWDPRTRTLLHTTVIGETAQAMCAVDGGLAVGLNTGVTVLEVNL